MQASRPLAAGAVALAAASTSVVATAQDYPNKPVGINSQVAAILKEQETLDALEKQGATPVGGSARDFAAMVRRDCEGWKPVIQRTGAGAN